MSARHARPGVAAAGVAAFVGSVTWAGPAQGSPAVLAAESAYAATSTVAATVVPCRPADLSATLVLTPVGGSSSSLAGAVVLADTSHRSCSLRGVPKVRVVGPSGQAVPVFEAPGGARHARPVTLQGSPSTARRPDAGTSITWSAWSCAKGSFALAVQFSGWKGPITVPWGSTAGYTGTPCSGGEATIYVGPVARAAAATP